MIACVDTQYFEDHAATGVVLFDHWMDRLPVKTFRHQLAGAPAQYVAGEFYRRELPCITAALLPHLDQIETVVIDGYVHLGIDQPGLGLKLFQQLDERKAIVGVAKKAFHSADLAIAVTRGQSQMPLFITAAGIAADEAARQIQKMHGPYRIPTLLKLADSIARENK
jgi:deoxyribonuclease V